MAGVGIIWKGFGGKMSVKKRVEIGSPRVLRLLGSLTLYYLVFFLFLWGSYKLIPGAQEYLPLGGGELFMGSTDQSDFEAIASGPIFKSNALENSLKLFLSVVGALLVMIPVTWVYMKIRLRAKLDQSLVETMLLLPIAVAGVVVIVQNSLALAFSLAGIVAGVRFRNTLKNTGDALFIFTAIGAGLAAGVGALEIAIVITLVFNYVFLFLWDLDYGAAKAEKYMRSSISKEKRGEK